MNSIVLDTYMIDALEERKRLMCITRKQEEPGTLLDVKETWDMRDGVLYYKQYCNKKGMIGTGKWRYANQMPPAYVRYRVKIICCTQMTEAQFYEKYGRCLRYNNRLWNYDGMEKHDNEWFRERQWQDEAAATSEQLIFVVEYELAEVRAIECAFRKNKNL